jgi:cytochrome c-type protein NapC
MREPRAGIVDRAGAALGAIRAWITATGARAPVVLAAALFGTGIVFWGGFNTAMEATNTLPFCISCHEMKSTVYEEYKQSVHHTNPSGVQAVCSDCHVPKEWTAKLVRKIQASQEVFHWLAGTISTPERFEAKRLALATRVWNTMKANNSQECRNCHNFSAMDTGGQGGFAGRMHAQAAKEGKTCIDCHKGISHKLPASLAWQPAQASRPAFDAELAEEINMTCAPCHGRQGQGTADGVYPRLAGLDPDYLTRQLQHFKAKTRINIPMLPYATERELPQHDVDTIVAYLTAIELPRKLGAADDTQGFDALSRLNASKAVLNVPLHTGDVERGRRLYAKECASCHGRDGYGDRVRTIPQLAGQHSAYLQRQIAEFAAGTRIHDDPADAAIFKAYGLADIDNLLAYLSTLDDQ